ncbi:unnamed protein product, partial [Porites lobata]
MISEHNSQTFENYQKHSQVKGTPIKTNSHIQDQEIYSFIETRVREVCPHEIEKLQVHRMQQGHPTIDFSILIDENKSLMTAIRLLNNELQTVLKADGVRCSRPNERPEKKEWLLVGAKKKKEKTKTKETEKDDPMIMTQVT